MKLFIVNDNENSFEHVVRCIQKYLNYPYMQGCSIADLVHNTGQCLVKESTDEIMLRGIYKALVKEGLHLRIES